MKILNDQTEYTISFKRQELKNMYFFFNKYLCHNPEPKSYDENYKTAKWFCDNFDFIV